MDQIYHFRYVPYGDAMQRVANLLRIVVERDCEIKVLFAETVVSEKGCAEGSGTYENGIC